MGWGALIPSRFLSPPRPLFHREGVGMVWISKHTPGHRSPKGGDWAQSALSQEMVGKGGGGVQRK